MEGTFLSLVIRREDSCSPPRRVAIGAKVISCRLVNEASVILGERDAS